MSHVLWQSAAHPAPIALFRDATEILLSVAEQRHAGDPSALQAPVRRFVRDADEAHAIAFDGPEPLVAMSLDDVLDCHRASHPAASDLVIIAGIHRGFLSLAARPGLAALADLKGRRVAVDTDTGYASALFHILRRDGLERDRDYEVVYAGATNLRFEKLLAGEFDATLLGAPYTDLVQQAGFGLLGKVSDALGGYQAIVLAARRPWLALPGNEEAAGRTVAAITQTLAFACDPTNRVRVTRMVQSALPALNAPAAAGVAEGLFGTQSDFLRDGRMRDADIEVVLDLFNRSRGAQLMLADVRRLVDTRLLPPAEAARLKG
ncbi:ABC transporter substrate-binding protein [Aquabacter sp. P-9]|uniref:ABC transporter substrate-binding protein n=1 Tax=Aquabacter sediminis TaxID=3029197 RepID=UPI00237E0BD2|nr:ABC transporter substrate-binding protein [Aquabacter sp. P-9]MDE1570623.1 ABC transporter substrate-binding protein [Aquabacter sp. P-9]